MLEVWVIGPGARATDAQFYEFRTIPSPAPSSGG